MHHQQRIGGRSRTIARKPPRLPPTRQPASSAHVLLRVGGESNGTGERRRRSSESGESERATVPYAASGSTVYGGERPTKHSHYRSREEDTRAERSSNTTTVLWLQRQAGRRNRGQRRTVPHTDLLRICHGLAPGKVWGGARKASPWSPTPSQRGDGRTASGEARRPSPRCINCCERWTARGQPWEQRSRR